MIELKSSVSRSALISVALMLAGLVAIGCGGHPVTGNTIVGTIRVTADNSSLNAGGTTQLHAMNTNSAGTTSDVTSTVAWSSGSPTVAAVSTTGLLTGMSAGSATITASLSGISGAYTASVGAPVVTGLTLTPRSSTVFTRAKQTYTAFATYANNTSGDATTAVTWTVTPASVATISGGLLTAVAPGNYTVTATLGVATAAAAGTVVDAPVSTIVVTPTNPTVAAGSTQKFTATATFADGTTADVSKSFNWASSDATLLTIDANGLATAIGTSGTVTVTGQFGSTSAKVTVGLTSAASVRALIVKPTSSSIATGSAEKHTATAIYSDGSQADVTGQVTWSVVPAVAPATARARGGVHAQARALPQDALSPLAVAAVDQTGVDKAGTPGTAAVQAALGGVAAQSTVIVTAATVQSLSIRATRDLFPVGATQPIQLIGQFSDGTSQDLSLTANWASSNPAVATIDQTGMATGVSGGDVVFTGSFGGLTASTVGYQVLSSALVSLTLSVDGPIRPVGTAQTPRLTGVYADGKTHDLTGLAKWESSDSSVYTIDVDGLAYAKGPGLAQLTATIGGLKAVVGVLAIPVTVASIEVVPPDAAMAQGTTLQLKALAHMSNGATVDFTSIGVWRSEDPSVLTVNALGVAKAGAVGTTRVTMTALAVTNESADIQVTGARMIGMKVLPYGPLTQGITSSFQIGAFTGMHFIATAIFDDNSFQEITRDAVWSTSDFTTASVDTTGLTIGLKPGSVGLTATAGGFSDTLPVTVTGATLQSAYLTPGGSRIPALTTQQFKMMGVFSDGTTQDLTQEAVWLAPTPTIADVQPGGVVIGLQPGIGSVSAQYGYFTAATPVTMTPAKLVSMTLTPANLTDRKFTLEQYVNMGTFDDGQVLDLGLDSVLSASDPSIAKVLLTGLTFTRKPGRTQIVAKAAGTTTATPLTVTSNVVSSVAVSPANPTIPPGSTQQFSAQATFDDGVTYDVSQQTQWTSSNPAVLSVDGRGLATAHASSAAATVTVTARFNNRSQRISVGTTTVTVPAGTAPVLTSIAITPQSPTIGSNQTVQFRATGMYTDDSTQNLSANVTWTTSDPTVMTVTAAGLGLPLSVGQLTVTATMGSLTANAAVTVKQAVLLTSLVVEPTSSSIATGSAEQHTATALYSDGSQVDVTKQVTWSVVAPTVPNGQTGALHAQVVRAALDLPGPIASVNTTGVGTAMTPGTAMVQASMGALSSQSTIIVTAATVTSLAIRATRDLFPAGSTQPVQLIGTFSDGSTQDLSLTANWISSDPTVATIDATGLAKGLKAGNVVFTGSFGGLTVSTIGYQVIPGNLVGTALDIDYPFLPLGANQQVRLIATYSDGTTHDLSALATWQSSDPSVFPIDPVTGVGYGLAPGKVQVTGTIAGRSALLEVDVADFKLLRIHVYPSIQKLARNTKRDFIAVADFSIGVSVEITSVVVWRSNDPTILTVDANGRAKTGRTGTTQMTASFLGVTGTSADVTVTPANLSRLSIQSATPQLAMLTGQHYTATGIFDDGSFQDLTNNVLWDTTDNTIASIDTAGYGIGMRPGQVQISARLQGVSASMPLTVTSAKMTGLVVQPGNTELPLGVARQFSAIAQFSDGTTEDVTKEAIWDSAAPGIVAAVLNGEAYGNGPGVGPMTALYGTFTASTPVSVTNVALTSMSISPTASTVRKGTVQNYTATGTFSDGFTQDLFLNAGFFTQDQNVDCFFNNGIAGATGLGTTVLGASFRDKSVTTTVQVTSDVLSSLTVSPANPSLFLGATQQLTATGTYTDGTTGDVTGNTVWTSSLPGILSINQNGLATALSLTGLSNGSLAPLAGTNQPVTVPASASSGGQTRSFNATVLPAAGPTLRSVMVSPSSSQLAKGTTGQLTATATYSDGSTADVSSSATWTSSNTSASTVNSTGLVMAVAAGTASVTAQVGTQSGSAAVQVTSATLVSVALSPNSASFAKGTSQQFTLTGNYSDGTTQNLSSSTSWTTSAGSVASITSSGLATGVGTGSVTITGNYGGRTASSGTVQVTPATLTSIAVTPSSPSFAKGTTQQFRVTGTYSDGTTQDLTGSSAYTSSNPGVVSVGSSGLATGTGTGSAQVTITSGGQTVTTGTVSVTPATLTSIAASPTSAHVAAGTTVQMGVTGTYTDGATGDVTSSATWTSSNTSLAMVNASGLVTGVSPGLPNVQAQIGSLSSSAVVRVSSATLVSVALSPSGASFALGAQQKFVMTGTFSDGSTQDLSTGATWSSSDTGVANVSPMGLASSVTAGSVAFTATYGGRTATTGTVTVTPATLVSIAVSPANPSFAKGTGQQFQVIGTYSDGTTHDVTGQATFSSSDASVVSVTNSGFGEGLKAGTVQITVTADGQTVTTGTVTATNATLVSVAITPGSPNVAAGTMQQFTAVGTFSDGTTEDLSGQSVWMSNNPQALTINQSGLASSFQVGSLQVSATIDGVTGISGSIQVTPATLASVMVTPATVQLAKGTTQQMTATGTYTDGTSRNVSTMVTWTSSNGAVASVNASGLATGTGAGSAQLTATLQGQTATTDNFTVTPATLVSISFNPANPTVAAGSTARVSVIGTYSDGTTQDLSSSATYSSSNNQVATATTTGVTGVASGTSTITVQAGGQTASFSVAVSNASLVSVAITPSNPAPFAKGTTQQFTATGTYSDGTTQNLSSSASWTSSNTAVFTVDQNGLATGTGVGSGQLTATYQGQTATTGSFSVGAATVRSVSVTPGSATIVAGSTQQYTATATYTDSTTLDVSNSATWSSSTTGVATINATGFATTVAAGATTVTAQLQSLSGTANLAVTAAPVTLQQIVVSEVGATHAAGSTQQFTATAVYSDQSTRDVTSSTTWSSTNTGVATINPSGLATLVAAGTTTIRGLFGGITGATSVTVAASATLQSITVNPSPASVAKGLTQQFTAMGTYSDGSTQNLTTQVSWQSSNTQIATIDNYGLATSRIGGQTQIQANFQGQGGQSTLTVSAATLVSLALTPSAVNLANGTRQQFIATGTLSDGSTQDYTTSVNWSSSNTSFATVSSTGLVTGTGVGTVTIMAQAGSVSRSATNSITAATPTSIQLTPSSVTVAVGGVQQMQATAMFTDGSSQDVTGSVTYTTSNAGVVTVDATGKLTGVSTGNASVTATLGSVSKTVSVQITMVALNSIAITPQNVSLAAGLSQQLTATGTYADGSTQDLTRSVMWSSSNSQIAAVTMTGNVTVSQLGTATITATTNGVSATDSVTATAATVTTITVSPASTTLAAGQTQQFAATAAFTDGSQQTVTASANWSVSDPAKGTISNSGTTKGFLTSSAAGTLNAIATVGSVNGSAPVTIQAAALNSLTIAPSPASLPAGTTQALTVTGSYTDGSTQNLTSSATYTTGTASIATVTTAGVLHAISQGSTSVQATVQGTSVTDQVTVTAAVLNSIAITPSAVNLALGLQQQLTAIGTYTDGSTANITSQVQWSSTAPSVGTVSATGLVSTLSTGTSTLRATLNGVMQQSPLTVTAAVLQSVTVTAPQNSFALGLSLQLTAIATYTDGTTQNVTGTATWTSTAPSVAMVSSSGLATGSRTGSFTARAMFNGVTGSIPLTVTAAILQTIVVTPANQIIVNVLGTTQFTATGHYSDGTTQDLTNSVHWTLSGPANVGTISQSGQLSGLHVGVAGTVTATQGTISGSTGFTVVGV